MHRYVLVMPVLANCVVRQHLIVLFDQSLHMRQIRQRFAIRVPGNERTVGLQGFADFEKIRTALRILDRNRAYQHIRSGVRLQISASPQCFIVRMSNNNQCF